jgi:plasmid maintenance system antidote protein VapI
MARKLKPVSPGEMLAEEFLKPLGMSNYRLAKEIGVPAQRGSLFGVVQAVHLVNQTCSKTRRQIGAQF